MYDSLVKQYEEAFGIGKKRKRARKCFSLRIKYYKTYKGIFGKKRAQKLMIEAISHDKL